MGLNEIIFIAENNEKIVLHTSPTPFYFRRMANGMLRTDIGVSDRLDLVLRDIAIPENVSLVLNRLLEEDDTKARLVTKAVTSGSKPKLRKGDLLLAVCLIGFIAVGLAAVGMMILMSVKLG